MINRSSMRLTPRLTLHVVEWKLNDSFHGNDQIHKANDGKIFALNQHHTSFNLRSSAIGELKSSLAEKRTQIPILYEEERQEVGSGFFHSVGKFAPLDLTRSHPQ